MSVTSWVKQIGLQKSILYYPYKIDTISFFFFLIFFFMISSVDFFHRPEIQFFSKHGVRFYTSEVLLLLLMFIQ